MSKVTWNKMTPATRRWPSKKFSREAQMEQRALWGQERGRRAFAKLKAAGIEWIEMDSKPFYDATAPARAKELHDLIKRINDVK